jgi:hypothetical protein
VLLIRAWGLPSKVVFVPKKVKKVFRQRKSRATTESEKSFKSESKTKSILIYSLNLINIEASLSLVSKSEYSNEIRQ